MCNNVCTYPDYPLLKGVGQSKAARDDAQSARTHVSWTVPAPPARQRLRRPGSAARVSRALRARRHLELHAGQRPLARRLLGHGGRVGEGGNGEGRLQVGSIAISVVRLDPRLFS